MNNTHNETYIYGFLSKTLLIPKDFISLWHYLLTIVTTTYIIFEVMEEHSRVYQTYLKPESIKKTKTFNGFESETLRMKIR
jgi:hypothetical protein